MSTDYRLTVYGRPHQSWRTAGEACHSARLANEAPPNDMQFHGVGQQAIVVVCWSDGGAPRNANPDDRDSEKCSPHTPSIGVPPKQVYEAFREAPRREYPRPESLKGECILPCAPAVRSESAIVVLWANGNRTAGRNGRMAKQGFALAEAHHIY